MARQLISGCLQLLKDLGGLIISVVLGQFGSAAYGMAEGEVKDIQDVEKQVEKLSSEFTAIQAVLEDAEKRQFKEATVQDWLDKLKDVSHDIDDVLDEWITAIRKANTAKEVKADEDPSPLKKVCLSNSPVRHLVLRRKIASKIKELNEKLDVIAAEKSRYSFNTTSIIEGPQQRPKTTSFVNIKNIRGRDIEEGVLISKLLCESNQKSEGVEIIPIVGMGGIGKTTLAQLAYHNVRVKAHFEKVIWICVSEPFDETRIAKAIIEALDLCAPNLGEMEPLLGRIHESVGGKRFLLILDDVWTEDARKWEPLKEALNSGARESKILVTTRKKEVAMMMRVETNNMILIKALSDEICWSIFSQLAFSGRDRCRQLEEIGEQIAIKCKGLPLVAKTLGGLMSYKTHIQQWNAVLHSKFWELEKDIDVFAPFMLSYNDLPSVEKRCLLYCSIFPKDHEMNKDELIKLWMSQGYLSRENLEQEGQDCFENLAMRSFFQDFTEDGVGNITSCKMHDIMHDFVQCLTKNECCVIDDRGKMERAGKKIRHATLLLESGGSDTDTTLSSLFEYKGLRTLFVTGSFYERSAKRFGLKRLYSNLTCLRSLNLSRGRINRLPQGIEKLIHLRHLDLSGSNIKELPNSMCDLFNLQTLDLKECRSLQQLPKGIGRLVSLRHLCIEGCYELKYMPKGIAKLSCLRTLDMFVVPGYDFVVENEKLELQDLKMLEHLQGSLTIVGCGNLEIGDEAVRASLKDNQHLVELGLDFRVKYADKNVEAHAEILEALKPHPNLETLGIYGYMGNAISPNWMMALINLKSLKLYFCDNCVSLPPLGKLPSLETLDIITYSVKIKRVGVEFLGIEEDDDNINGEPRSRRPQISFPKLKKLQFCYLFGWEKWELGINLGEEEEEEDNWLTIMPSIQSLEIRNCWRLTALPGFLRKTPLQHLVIRGCPILVERCREGVGEDWPKISHIPNIQIYN